MRHVPYNAGARYRESTDFGGSSSASRRRAGVFPQRPPRPSGPPFKERVTILSLLSSDFMMNLAWSTTCLACWSR